MKLRNKLIPLASMLAVGATVAPISTSCASVGFVDLKDGFNPTISRLHLEKNELTAEQAEQVYFNAVSENPDIIAQDLNWSMSTALRAAAENPANMLHDKDTSILNYARQYVSNIKVGETVLSDETKVHTVSFDAVREQQFTYTYLDQGTWIEPGTNAKVKRVGTTLYKIHYENVPMNFNMSLASEESSNAKPQPIDPLMEDNYNPHLGRGLYSVDLETYNPYYRTRKFVPTKWFLSSAVMSDYGDLALESMVDPWEISYEMTTNDTVYTTYNDTTTVTDTGSTYTGKFNNYEICKDDEQFKEIACFSIGSYYLADLGYKEAE